MQKTIPAKSAVAAVLLQAMHRSREPVKTKPASTGRTQSHERTAIMIDTPGIYTMPLTEYLADPCPEPAFSTSVAHAMLTKTPLHAWMQHPRLNPDRVREDSIAMDLGTVAHSILLEGHMNNVVIVEADDWRTKDAKAQRDAARLAGKTPILVDKARAVMQMVKVAQETIRNSELASAFADGKPEQTLIWKEGDIWCKARPDMLTKDLRLDMDFKTTAGSAEPTAFMRGVMLGSGYDLQCALRLRGLRALGARDPQFVFMVQEIEPPYCMSFIGLSPAFLDVADRKLTRALEMWGDCLLTNCWPGYPSRVCWIEPPAWLQIEEGVPS
ncbi:MAG: hypothetical protein D4R44_08075 [Actinobacteria bacterium]|nr:MAG: hypothetical protein D4R44_08075 [Actinomycetota bacterium]